MRIVFMGTPEFAVPTLAELVARGHEVAAVYTRAPRPAGRGQRERRSPVHLAAEGFSIPVHTPRSLKAVEEQATFAMHAPHVAVVVAYGLILPGAILSVPVGGCLNLHASLLPRWRGAAPIQRAIMAGDTRTGLTVMRMEEGLDTGPIGLVEDIPIGPDVTAGDLQDRMAVLGADLMGRALAALERDSLAYTPQPQEGVTYAPKIEKTETRIDWRRPAREVHDHMRGLSPFPGAWFALGETRVKVLRSTLAEGAGAPGTILGDNLTIACGAGAVRLLQVQREGRAAMDAAAFVRGAGALPSVAG
jgi:methionyl-tRNA formyltransferase